MMAADSLQPATGPHYPTVFLASDLPASHRQIKKMAELHTIEIRYETGEVRFRYSQHLSSDGARWLRHGLFRAYYRSGELQFEGNYIDGHEYGVWRDFHKNGRLAAEGRYENGVESCEWKYWREDGSPE